MREIEREHVRKEGVRVVFRIYPVEAPDEKEPSGPIIINTHLQKRRLTLRGIFMPFEHLLAQDSIAPPCLLQLAMIENLSALVVALETHRIGQPI